MAKKHKKYKYENPFTKYYPFGNEMVYQAAFLSTYDFRCNNDIYKRFPHLADLKEHELVSRITDELFRSMLYVEKSDLIDKSSWQRKAAFDMAEVWREYLSRRTKTLNHYELMCVYVIVTDTFENFC